MLDEVGSYLGLRSVGVARGRFLLNGRPYYLRLVLEQGYWPESHLAAPTPTPSAREVQLVKALGFNGVRIHQKIEDPRFLAWCDRLGLLVWAEMPSAYAFSPTAIDRLTREWIEALARDPATRASSRGCRSTRAGASRRLDQVGPAATYVRGALPPDQGARPDAGR